MRWIGGLVLFAAFLLSAAFPSTVQAALPDAEPGIPPDVQMWLDRGAQARECGEVYKVVRGDTMSEISRDCGVSLSRLIISNPHIKNPSRIYAGQEIHIPGPPDIESNPDREQVLAEVNVEEGQRWVDVDLSQQTLHAYEGDQVVRSFIVSTGTWRYPTVTGQFEVWVKFETDDMRGPGYFLRDVPYVMYFHKGYGLHGTYWHDNFGTPMSHGCVNLSVEDAAWLFDFLEVGDLVNVHI